ncbi:MAG: hypothetical protein ABI614_00160 [Planctomycetota bacterium]
MMIQLYKRFSRDESGGILSSEYLVLGALLTLGLVVGMSAVRDTLVSEMEDYAAALLGLDDGEIAGFTSFKGNERGPN